MFPYYHSGGRGGGGYSVPKVSFGLRWYVQVWPALQGSFPVKRFRVPIAVDWFSTYPQGGLCSRTYFRLEFISQHALLLLVLRQYASSVNKQAPDQWRLEGFPILIIDGQLENSHNKMQFSLFYQWKPS